MLEINSHSLFSKWFSESGKLIMKLFDTIQEMVEDKNSLVCILIGQSIRLRKVLLECYCFTVHTCAHTVL